MTNTATKINFDDLHAGLRIDYTGDAANLPGEGVVVRTWIDSGFGYQFVAVKLDDGREMRVMVNSFNGPGRRFEISEDQTPPAERQQEATVDAVVAMLPHFNLSDGVRPTNFLSARIRDGWYHLEVCGVWWSISNNGGEFMVGELNSSEHRRAVPLSSGSRNLNEATVAHRVAQVLRGEAIDYGFLISDDEQEVLAGAAN